MGFDHGFMHVLIKETVTYVQFVGSFSELDMSVGWAVETLSSYNFPGCVPEEVLFKACTILCVGELTGEVCVAVRSTACDTERRTRVGRDGGNKTRIWVWEMRRTEMGTGQVMIYVAEQAYLCRVEEL